MKHLVAFLTSLLAGCTIVPMSSIDYDLEYGSKLEESYDKFEGVITLNITPVDISTKTGPLGQTLDTAKISFQYHFGSNSIPDSAFFSIVKDSFIPALESSRFKFESNGKLQEGTIVSYKKYPRQVGNSSVDSYSSSYSESTKFVESAMYKFEIESLCPFNKLSNFEFKAGNIYRLDQGYSVSLSKWCDRIAIIRGGQK